MKRIVASLTIAGLAIGAGSFTALDAQRGDPQRPRFEQGQGPQRPGMRGPGFRRGGPGGPGGPDFPLHGLDLTEEQKAQVKALHDKLRQDIEALLTPEQLAKLKARRGGE